MLKKVCPLVLLSIICSCQNDQGKEKYAKKDYKAILCLTYDDGMETHYKNAIPHLDEFGLKGTFFINNVSNREAVIAWRNASKNGHELGNHTLFHPCPTSFGWPSEVTIDNYTPSLLFEEIKTVNSILNITELRDKPRSFAYPCNNMFIGTNSYKEDLKSSKLVTFARTGSEEKTIIKPTDGTIDPMSVPSWIVPENTGYSELIAYVNSVIKENGVGILQFHGIGGEWIKISNEDHYRLLEYLSNHKEDILVTTFTEAMKHLNTVPQVP